MGRVRSFMPVRDVANAITTAATQSRSSEQKKNVFECEANVYDDGMSCMPGPVVYRFYLINGRNVHTPAPWSSTLT